LKGFLRVELNPGESKKITIPLTEHSLMYWHPTKNTWVMPEGPVFVEIGFSERDIRMKAFLPKLPSPEAVPPKQTESPEPGNPQLK